jgi:hypothetical protein
MPLLAVRFRSFLRFEPLLDPPGRFAPTLAQSVLVGALTAVAMGCGAPARVADLGGAEAGDAGASPPADAGAVLGLQSGSPWPMFAQSPRLQGRSTAVGPAHPSVRWFYPATLTGQPAIAADGTVYFGAAGTVVALRSDGSVKWTFDGAPTQRFGGTPAIRADGSVLVGASSGSDLHGQLLALSPAGTLLWTYDTSRGANGAFPSASVGDDGTIYFSVAYHLYAIHPDGSPAWQADAGDEYGIVPAIGSDGTVYNGGQYGLQAFTPAGHQLWAFGACADLVSECTSQASVADDGTIVTTVLLLAPSSGYLLTAVRPHGAAAWSFALPVQGVGSAVAADGTILVPRGVDVVSVSPAGKQKWVSALAGANGASAPVIDGAGTLYLGTSAWTEAAPCGSPCEELSGAGLQAVHADGTAGWVFQPGIAFASPAIGADGTLYAAALGGRSGAAQGGARGLYALGP